MTVNGTSVGAVTSYVFPAVTTNKTIAATFAINTYTITASPGANGAISPAGVTTVNYGATPTYTITPDTGYHVVDVTVNGTSVGAVTSYVFPAVTTNKTIEATFTINTYTIIPSVSGGNGTISPSTVQTVNYGATPTFTFTPASGYHLNTVTVNGTLVTPTGNNYTFPAVTTNKTIAATFAINTYTITPSILGGNGTISPSTVQTVNYGATPTFTFTPNTGYRLNTVTVNGTLVTPTGNNYTFPAVTTNKTIVATFAINTYTITPSILGGNGTISPSTVQTVNYGATPTFTFTPNTGYRLNTVTVNGTLVTPTGNNYTFPAVTTNKTIAATFTINTYTIIPSVSGGNGTISPSTVQTVNYGATPTFTFTPASGYHLNTVTVNGTLVTPTGNNYTFPAVTTNKTIAATFAINTYTITPSILGGNGTISPSTVQTVNYGATPTFTFTPNTGYRLNTVTVNGTLVTPTGNNYTFPAVTTNKTIVGTFARLPVKANFTGNPVIGEKPLTVQFTDASTGGAISWNWAFGDGTTSTVQNPSKTYQNVGNYTISLTVGNGTGSDTLTRTNYIRVTKKSFVNYTIEENVFVYGNQLSFSGDGVSGPGATVVITGGLTTDDLNGGTSIDVTTIYIDGNVNLNGGSAGLGSSVEPGDIYVNGSLTLWNGQRHIYGDVYVAGDFSLKDARIHGDVYVDGDVTLGYTPTLDANSHIYYTGTLTVPTNYNHPEIVSKCIHQATVPAVEMPNMDIPPAKSAAWYAERGYVSGGTLTDYKKIYASSYSSSSWNPGASNVIIVATSGDITITGFGGSTLTGVLFAPNGKVTFNGERFEGLVIARDGFDVTSGGTEVIFRNLDMYVSDPDDYPF
ncbi:MAG: hypothetical protein STSR0009_21250 [Methanoregula sp.]